MKTVFKVGMNVYDQVFYPNQKGTVKRIDNNESDIDFPIEVEFKGEIESYTLKGSRSYAGALTLSTAPYTLQGFEQKATIPTFEEVWEEAERFYEPKNKYKDEKYGGYPSQELANASEALRRLLFLRDYYNKGWQPDWGTEAWKYFIVLRRVYPIVDFEIDYSAGIPHVLAFKTRVIAVKFLEEQRELLEIAKPLL